MNRFELVRAQTTAQARELLAERPGSVLKAGGIDLLLVPQRNTPLTQPFTGPVVEVATLTEAIEAACALSGKAGSGRVVCVVSGGNIDVSKLCAVLRGEVPP